VPSPSHLRREVAGAPDRTGTDSTVTSKGRTQVTDGSEEMPLHAARGDLERLGDLVGRPLLHLAKDEDLLLAAGQSPKRDPPTVAELGVARRTIGVPRLGR